MAKMVYNPSPYPVRCTESGKSCDPHSWAVADDKMGGNTNRLVEIDPDTIADSGTNPIAIMVRNEVQAINKPKSDKPKAEAGTTTKASTKRAKK